MKKLTLIITALNEGKEPQKTIESIYEHTAEHLEEIQIILFDDGSEEPIKLPKKLSDVQLVRHEQREGISYCREKGVELAQTPYVGILNSRMRFTPGWYEKVIVRLESEPKTLFCTTSVVLWDMDAKEVRKLKEKYTDEKDIALAESHAKRIEGLKNIDQIDSEKERKYGANIIGWDKKSQTLMQVNWRNEEEGDCYEIPCVLGANYFTSKKWWNYIRGEKGLRSYGSGEEFISLKTWAFGGKVKIMKDVEIGNKYRFVKSYTDNVDHLIWNKLFIAFTLLPWKKAYWYMFRVRDVDLFSNNYETVRNMLISEMPYIMSRRMEFSTLIVNNVEHLIIEKDGN